MSVLAQESSKANKLDDKHGMELTAFVGIQLSNFSNLNDRLKSLNTTTLKPDAVNIGIGAAVRFNKIIVGFDGGPLANHSNIVETSGYFFHFYLSTNILRSGRCIFSPQVGIGGQDLRATITQESTTQSFDQAITTATNQVTMRNYNTMLDVAMNLKLMIRNHYRPIIRIGYRYGLSMVSWEIENGSVTDAPKDRGSNFYFQLMFGFGR